MLQRYVQIPHQEWSTLWSAKWNSALSSLETPEKVIEFQERLSVILCTFFLFLSRYSNVLKNLFWCVHTVCQMKRKSKCFVVKVYFKCVWQFLYRNHAIFYFNHFDYKTICITNQLWCYGPVTIFLIVAHNIICNIDRKQTNASSRRIKGR